MCPVRISSEVDLAEATIYRRDGWRRSRDLANTCATLQAAEEKKIFQSQW